LLLLLWFESGAPRPGCLLLPWPESGAPRLGCLLLLWPESGRSAERGCAGGLDLVWELLGAGSAGAELPVPGSPGRGAGEPGAGALWAVGAADFQNRVHIREGHRHERTAPSGAPLRPCAAHRWGEKNEGKKRRSHASRVAQISSTGTK
jgi:hypothetical protein